MKMLMLGNNGFSIRDEGVLLTRHYTNRVYGYEVVVYIGYLDVLE